MWQLKGVKVNGSGDSFFLSCKNSQLKLAISSHIEKQELLHVYSETNT